MTDATLKLCEDIVREVSALRGDDTLALCELIVEACEQRAEARKLHSMHVRALRARKAA
jgi:hypothetical protein